MPRKPILLGWGIRKEGRSLWTRNANRGVSLWGERRKRDGRVEWRQWSPKKSKVAAALVRTKGDPSELLPKTGSTCLYLGASAGSTVSHILITYAALGTTMEDRSSQWRFRLG